LSCSDLGGIGGVCAWTPAGGLVKLLVTGDPEPDSASGTITGA